MPRSCTSGVEDGTYFEIGEGRDIHLEEAPEPTDIIWENRETTKAQRIKAIIIQWVVMFICISISFFLIFYCSNISN
jgi:hypothetical protein